MRTVVTYDISNDKCRKRVSDILEELLIRVQYSVFEGEPPRELLQSTIQRTIQHIDPKTDSIRVYYLCASCGPKTEIYGRGPAISPDPLQIL